MDPTRTPTARSVLADLTLSLPDIAFTAGVQRPVVSMWRTRHARGPHPFPSPVTDGAGPPRFLASDVVAWMERTGLGNNPHFAADVAVRGALDARPDGDRPTDGLLALLCLRAYGEVALADLASGDVLDLATLGDGLAPRNPHRGRVFVTMAAIAGITALDVLAAAQLSSARRNRIRPSSGVRPPLPAERSAR